MALQISEVIFGHENLGDSELVRPKGLGISMHQAALADGSTGPSDAGIAKPVAMDTQLVGSQRDRAGTDEDDLTSFSSKACDAGCQGCDLARIELLVRVTHHPGADLHHDAASVGQKRATIDFV